MYNLQVLQNLQLRAVKLSVVDFVAVVDYTGVLIDYERARVRLVDYTAVLIDSLRAKVRIFFFLLYNLQV